MENRFAAVVFSHHVLNEGIHKDHFSQILDALPEDAKITNFFNYPEKAMLGITIFSEEFKIVQEGTRLPEIVAEFRKNCTRHVELHKLDLSEVLENKKLNGIFANSEGMIEPGKVYFFSTPNNSEPFYKNYLDNAPSEFRREYECQPNYNSDHTKIAMDAAIYGNVAYIYDYDTQKLKTVNPKDYYISNVVDDHEKHLEAAKKYSKGPDLLTFPAGSIVDPAKVFTGSLVINELPLECKHNWQEYVGFTSKDVFCTLCLMKKE